MSDSLVREVAMLAMKTILYPTDFSADAQPAFEVACVLANEGGSRLVVLHVERSPLTTLGGTTFVPPLPDEYGRETSEEKLKAIQPLSAGIAVEHRLEYGDPATVILEVAQEIGADLIVMGTHGRTGLQHLLMGSVAERIVRTASCPVLTVRGPSIERATLRIRAGHPAHRGSDVLCH